MGDAGQATKVAGVIGSFCALRNEKRGFDSTTVEFWCRICRWGDVVEKMSFVEMRTREFHLELRCQISNCFN